MITVFRGVTAFFIALAMATALGVARGVGRWVRGAGCGALGAGCGALGAERAGHGLCVQH